MASAGKLLLKGSVLRLIHMASAILVGFYMMPFLIRSLGTDQYGLWILIGSILSLFTLLDAGMVGVTQRYVIRAMHTSDDQKVNLAISTSFFLFIGIGIITALVTLLLILIGPYFFEEPDNIPLFQKTIAILGFGTAFNLPMAAFYGIITAKNRFDLLTYINIISLLFRTILILYFVSNGSNISILALITISMLAFEKVISVFIARKFFKPLHISPKYFRLKLLKEYFKYSKWVYLTTTADHIRVSLDDFLVAGIVGLTAVTHYAVAATLMSYFRQVMASIFGVIAPTLNKYHKLDQMDKLKRVFISVTELTTIASCLIIGLLVILGQTFITIWIGDTYNDSYYILVILCISSVISASQMPSVSILYAIAKHPYYSKMTLIDSAFNLGLSLTLANIYGIYGIALGTMIPVLFTKLYFQPRYTCKQLDIEFSKYMKTLLFKIILSISFFILLYVTLIKNMIQENYLSLFLLGAIISISYLFFSIRFLISNDTKKYLSDMLPKKITSILQLVKLF